MTTTLYNIIKVHEEGQHIQFNTIFTKKGISLSFFDIFLLLYKNIVLYLGKYKIALSKISNETLLSGVVALIAATVIKRAIAIKEEQELTI